METGHFTAFNPSTRALDRFLFPRDPAGRRRQRAESTLRDTVRALGPVAGLCG